LKLFDDIGEPEQEETEIKQELEFYDLEEMAESIQLFADQDEDIYDVEYPDNQEAAMSLNSRVTNISNRYHGLQYIHNQTENGRFVNPYKKSWDQINVKKEQPYKNIQVDRPKHKRPPKSVSKPVVQKKENILSWFETPVNIVKEITPVKKAEKTIWIREALQNYLNKYNYLREDINLCIWVTNEQSNLYLYAGTQGLKFISISEIFTDLRQSVTFVDVNEIIIKSINRFCIDLFVHKNVHYSSDTIMYLMIRRLSGPANEIFAEMYVKNDGGLELISKLDIAEFFEIPFEIYQKYLYNIS
jgi:hypothetical protein